VGVLFSAADVAKPYIRSFGKSVELSKYVWNFNV
jgi:hypothetical protein